MIATSLTPLLMDVTFAYASDLTRSATDSLASAGADLPDCARLKQFRRAIPPPLLSPHDMARFRACDRGGSARLQNAGELRQVPLRMIARSAAGCVEQGCWWQCSGEGPIVADIDLGPVGGGLGLRQDRHRRARGDLISQRRQARRSHPLCHCPQDLARALPLGWPIELDSNIVSALSDPRQLHARTVCLPAVTGAAAPGRPSSLRFSPRPR